MYGGEEKRIQRFGGDSRGKETVVSVADSMRNVSWMLFPEGRSS